jgi:hypothetical protein
MLGETGWAENYGQPPEWDYSCEEEELPTEYGEDSPYWDPEWAAHLEEEQSLRKEGLLQDEEQLSEWEYLAELDREAYEEQLAEAAKKANWDALEKELQRQADQANLDIYLSNLEEEETPKVYLNVREPERRCPPSPPIPMKAGWSVSVLSHRTAEVRLLITDGTGGEASVLYDPFGELHDSGTACWEVYPHNDDVAWVDADDIPRLVELIEYALTQTRRELYV